MPAPRLALKGMTELHSKVVLDRRESVLADAVSRLLPPETTSVLDVGCGDGVVAAKVSEARPGLRVEGLEVLQRPACRISCSLYDGRHIPFPDDSFDVVTLIDILHHTEQIPELIAECARVARCGVVVKDHLWSGSADLAILRLMDWVGNRGHGVNLTYNYQNKSQWDSIFDSSGLVVHGWDESLGLYPFPFNLLFERGKHFVALLTLTESHESSHGPGSV